MGKKRKKRKVTSVKADTDTVIYTDGGCMYNPGGPGGYGIIVVNRETGEEQVYTEAYTSTTNNRMEVMAILRALKETDQYKEPVTIYSDSQYAINCATGAWQRNKNRDLWKQYENLAKGRDIRFIWIRGHSGNTYNERCDELAMSAMQSGGNIPDKGYMKAKATGREYYRELERHGEISTKAQGGAMSVRIDISDKLNKMPQIGSAGKYIEQHKVHRTCAKAIMDFYLEGITSFKAYAKIKTGGIDYWSRKKKDMLMEEVGSETWDATARYFDNEKQAETCAKWICRGLKPSDAVRKVLVDLEITANCIGRR